MATFYTSQYTGREMDAAIAKAHTHLNKETLDNIPSDATAPSESVLTHGSDGALAWRRVNASMVGGVHIEKGVTAVYTLAGATTVVNVEFNEPFDSIPAVSVCLESDGSTYRLGSCSAAIVEGSLTQRGMQIRLSSGAGTSYSFKLRARWMAIE